MHRYIEGKDLLYEAIILKILVKVALMAIKDKQPIRPHLIRLCMLIKVLQPLKTKRVICPAILRD